MNPALHTANQIATALGKSPRLIRRKTSSIKPDGEIVVRGNLTAAWRIESLPPSMQSALDALYG